MLATFTTVTAYLLQFKYIALFVSIFLSAAFVPVSGELIVVGAGAMVASGGMVLFIAFSICLFANVLGDVFGYIIMRFFGNKYGRGFENKSKTFHSMGTYLRKRPLATVLFSRFVGFTAGQINFLAGLTRTPIRAFILGDVIGNTICVVLYLVTGYLAESSGYSVPGVAAIIAGVLFFFAAISFAGAVYIERKKA